MSNHEENRDAEEDSDSSDDEDYVPEGDFFTLINNPRFTTIICAVIVLASAEDRNLLSEEDSDGAVEEDAPDSDNEDAPGRKRKSKGKSKG